MLLASRWAGAFLATVPHYGLPLCTLLLPAGPDAPSQLLLAASNGRGGTAAGAKRPHHAVRQRDADLEPLRHQYAMAEDPAKKAAAKVGRGLKAALPAV